MVFNFSMFKTPKIAKGAPTELGFTYKITLKRSSKGARVHGRKAPVKGASKVLGFTYKITSKTGCEDTRIHDRKTPVKKTPKVLGFAAGRRPQEKIQRY